MGLRGPQIIEMDIQDKIGVGNDADSELADLEMETRPEDVLAEIDRLQRHVRGGKKLPA